MNDFRDKSPALRGAFLCPWNRKIGTGRLTCGLQNVNTINTHSELINAEPPFFI
nr:MAG TPA: hypothetical protein [Caudoviricetes sp.]